MKIINQSIIKGNNLREMYEIIFHEKSVSRIEIAKRLNLSKTTVSCLAEELIGLRLVEDLGVTKKENGVGRNPNGLGVVSGANFIAVIDWSKERTELRLVDISSGESILCRNMPVKNDCDYADATKACYLIAKDYLRDTQKLLAVCIIIPGLIDSKQETIISIQLGIDSEIGRNLIKKLRSYFYQTSACLLNDSACMAYAEIDAARLEKTDFAYINAVNGIGAAIYYNQRILGNATGLATQIGHCCVKPNGPVCGCGSRGCLDVVAGESALTDYSIDVGKDRSNQKNRELNYTLLRELADKGNKQADEILMQLADYFSTVIVYLVSIVYPEKIVIGGRGQNLGTKFMERLKANLVNMGFHYMMMRASVSFAETTDEDRFIGAARYFMKEYFDYSGSIINGFYLG